MKVKKQATEEPEVPAEVPAETESKNKTSRLNNALALLKSVFEIDEGYMVTAFKDKGGSLGVTMNSRDFEVTVIIKDTESFSI